MNWWRVGRPLLPPARLRLATAQVLAQGGFQPLGALAIARFAGFRHGRRHKRPAPRLQALSLDRAGMIGYSLALTLP